MLVIMAVALLALAGLVVDGGAKLDEAENASAVAQEAARAGAGMVNQGKAYSTGAFAVDPSRAIAAAQAYLASVAAAGYTGSVNVGPESIQVTVTVTQPTKILSIIGIDSMTVTRTATAALVTGVTGPRR
jgi:Tfp pilus assembly protein PilV